MIADMDHSGIIDGPMQQKSVAARGGEMDWKCQIKRRGKPAEVAALIAWLVRKFCILGFCDVR